MCVATLWQDCLGFATKRPIFLDFPESPRNHPAFFTNRAKTTAMKKLSIRVATLTRMITVTWFQSILAVERVLPLLLFALYLITAVRVCRYSSWLDAGAPNPFLPAPLKVAARNFELRCRFAALA